MRNPKVFAVGIAFTAILILFSGCNSSSLVTEKAKASFNAVADASGSNVTWVEEDSAWMLASTQGDEVYFSSDFSRNAGGSGMPDMDKPDAEFSFDVKPFLAAGLDPSKLPMVEGVKYEIEGDRFMLHFELGNKKTASDTKDSLKATFAEIARIYPNNFRFHKKLYHYGIMLADGNMIEWAQDLSMNSNDLVWILNLGPLVQAGLDPAKVSGWTPRKFEEKDERGKVVFVDKLIKAVNLK